MKQDRLYAQRDEITRERRVKPCHRVFPARAVLSQRPVRALVHHQYDHAPQRVHRHQSRHGQRQIIARQQPVASEQANGRHTARARSSRVAPAQASLGPCDSRVARASRLSPRARVSAPRAARRTPAPSFARRARSPRSIAAFDRRRARRFAAQHHWSRAKRAKFDRPACRERRRRAAEDAATMVARGATVCVGARCGHASWRARERRTTRCARLRHETTRRRRAC